jgi:cytochrome c-type biogenesis protein CcmE
MLAEQPAPYQRLRLGGLVVEGSLVRGQGREVSFRVTDNATEVDVVFTGVLPDLFAEGQSAVSEGYWRNGRFEAFEVLAKHDESYMPNSVKDTLQEPRPGL